MGRDSNSRRFPGFDVVKQSDHWDARTRDVVLQRFRLKPGRSFFSVDEEAVCRALLAALLAIGPNDSEIRVFEMVDGRLAAGVTDGWRYEDMPPDTEAWRLSLAELGSTTFLGLGLDGRLQVL
ncbi:MAG: gluconate 2-dehydrogenase subunit 3 family protein, partial [Terriglobia bacterium]